MLIICFVKDVHTFAHGNVTGITAMFFTLQKQGIVGDPDNMAFLSVYFKSIFIILAISGHYWEYLM